MLFWFFPPAFRATILDGSCEYAAIDEGDNVERGDTCGLDPSLSMIETDPRLGPLRDNGGPTLTHALLPGSPAIDAIPVEDCTWDDDGDPSTPEVPLLYDQRRIARPKGPACDIGSVEVPESAHALLLATGGLVLAGAHRLRIGRATQQP